MKKNVSAVLRTRIIEGKTLLLLWISFSSQSIPQTILRSVEFINNSFYTQRQLSGIVSLKENAPPDSAAVSRAENALIESYRKEGFYAFHIDSVVSIPSSDSEFVSLQFYLNEGSRFVVSKIRFSGNTVMSDDELSALVTFSTGHPLPEEELETDIHHILDAYADRGFPFTKITSDRIRLDSSDVPGLVCQLSVNEGPRVYITAVDAEGNTTTRTNVIAREFRIQKGELFNQSKLDDIRRRLDHMQLFTSISEPQLYIIPGGSSDSLTGGLRVTVAEANANSFDGILGYVPSTIPSRKGYFTGNILISMRNLFGTGRKASVRWQRETEVTQEFQLQYREPWLVGLPVDAGISLFQRKQDSSYVKSRIEIVLDYAVTDELSLGINGSSESVYPAADQTQFSVFASSSLFFGGEILYDSRDNVRNPTRGVRYATTFQEGTKDITGPQKFLYLTNDRNFTVQKYSVDAELYIQTFPRQVVMAGVHGKQTTSSQLELSDLYQFGGTNSVRGYLENQFYASQIAWSTIEYRFLTGRASSLLGFIDGGYFSRPSGLSNGISSQEKSIYGYGVGARVETGLGILTISYALGEGDGFSEGKIHFGIANDF